MQPAPTLSNSISPASRTRCDNWPSASTISSQVLIPRLKCLRRSIYVAYKTSQNIVCMEVKQQRVLLYLKLDPKVARGPKGISRDVTDVGHYGTGDLEVSLKDAHDLEAAKPFIQSAYEQVGG